VPRRGYRLLQQPRFVDEPDPVNETGVFQVPDDGSFIGKLMRRGVVQAGAAYMVFSWALIQVADIFTPTLNLPFWVPTLVTVAAIGGFPIVLVLAWLLEQRDGRWFLDRGRQSGKMLSGLERNYLSILVAYGIAAVGAYAYQALVGFEVAETQSVAAVDQDSLLPVRPNSIAVLKFLNIGGNETGKFFSEGLCEDILDRLARIPGLSVSSRGDSWSLPDNASSDIVRERLRVAYFLEGSVRVIGDELRVVVQLIESATGFHVFSRSFETKLDDHMDVQREITELAVANLRVALPEDTHAGIAGDEEDPEVDAYLLYRRGKSILDEPVTEESIADARAYFEQALTVDPDYPAAHAGICRAEVALFHRTRDPGSITAAENACSAALRANPNLGIVFRSIGFLYLADGRFSEAIDAFSRVLEANPRDAKALEGLATAYENRRDFDDAEDLYRQAIDLQPGNWRYINSLGTLYFTVGRYSDAAQEYKRVVLLDPGNWIALGNLGSVLMMAGKYEEAVDHLNRSLAIEQDALFLANLGISFYYLGDYERAVHQLRRAADASANEASIWLSLGDAMRFSMQSSEAVDAYREAMRLAREEEARLPSSPANLYRLAWATAGTGDLDEAETLIERSLSLAPESPYGLYYQALIRTERGETKAAIQSLRAAVEQNYPVAMIASDPLLAVLWGERDFEDLLASGKD
jgi:tetratricopeptide (TPR) repeat protein